ncbi:MAG: hypothetical protein MH321_14260 [Leptospiraceae bacterium]|nr:hypothetical protein [Leptospiraceae bacterium]
MLNNYIFKISSYTVIFSLILFLNDCNRSNGIKKFKDTSELNIFLKSKGYIINTYGWKRGEAIETVEFRKSTNYSTGDLEIICSIPTLTRIKFDKVTIPNLTEDEMETCANINNLKFDYRRVILSRNHICDISEKSKFSKLSFIFTETNVDDRMLECLSKIKNLESIGVADKSEITEQSICSLTANLKSITSFRLSEVPFSRKALDCIFTLPNLKRVSLQNWSQVPEEKIWELVHEYEDRHGRKLDAIIDDPTSIDSTVWPKNNN